MSKLVKRFLMLFLLVISFFSTSVFAKEVDIKVDEAKVVSKSSTAEVETPAIDGNNINTSATFNEQDDFVTYEITIKNNDDESWKIDSVEDNYTKDNLKIDYEYDNELIKKGKTSKVKVTITYKKKLVNTESINIDDLKISLNLINESGDTTTIGINNPNTRDGILKYLVLLIVAVTGLIFIKNKKRYKRLKVGNLLVLIAIVMSPFMIFAEEKYQMNINIKSFTLKSEYLDYEISFDTDGAGNVDTRTVTYGQPIGELPNVSKDGYTFNGWKDQDGNVVTENTIVKGKLDLEAEFTVKEYNIAYNLDNGTVTPSSANPTKYTIEDEFELVNPTRKGYTFAGWTEGESENLYTRVTISHETGTKAYTAHWSKNENTKYYVNHKYPNLDGTYETVREELTGPTDTEVTAPFKPKTGFDNPTTSQSLTISADEDSEVTYTYTRHEYELTLNDDIETTFTNPKYPYETEITLTAKDKENFEFTGWSNGETTKTITFNITEDTNVYPEYVSTLITVTFNPNGGTVDETTRSVNKETAIGELPTPTAQAGKDFDAWYTELTGGTKVTSSYIVNNNITIYARYTDQTFTITFDTDGGTSVDNQTITYGNKVTKPTTNPTKEGYTFDDWYTDNTYTTKFDFENTEITSTTTIYGKFNLNRYTVSFNTDGGSSVSSQTVDHGSKASKPTSDPTKEGYVFVNWYTDTNYNTLFDFNTEITSDTIIYAKFKANPFPVVFSEPGECTFNGSSGVLTGDNCSYANGTNQYIDTGINLYNSENHDKDYEIGFTIVSTNLSEQVSQATFMNTKLEGSNYPGLVFRKRNGYSQFDLSSRKSSSANEVKYMSDSGVETVKIYRITNEDTGVQEIFYSINDEEKVKVNDLSQFNPEFNLSVWFGAAPTNASATAAQRILVNTTLKDMYIKLGTYQESSNTEKYKITYNANGGSVTPTSTRINIGDQIGTLPTPTAPAGKTFTGWYIGLTDGVEVTSSYIPSSNITIYARYYTDITGATVSPSSISIINGANQTITVSNVEEEYTFSSNNTSIATVDQTGKVTGIEVGTTTITITGTTSGKTKTINVTVEANTYTVTFNANGGSVSPSSKTINIGDQIGTLPTPTPPTNKTFDGWYTKLTGGIKVTSSYIPNNNITIYARYINDISGATISPSSISIINGNNQTITVSNVEEEYTFSSNDTNIATVDSTGKVTGIEVGTTTITITGTSSGKTKTINVTVESNTYTVTLNPNGGTVNPTSITQNKGTAIGELPTPTAPTGKEFDAWYTGLTDGTKVTSSYTPNSNVTIYARYNNTCGTFATDSWSTIKTNLASDSSYYAVGCEKEVELDMDNDGTNESYTVRLANTSTPSVCETSGYSGTACGTVIEFVDIVGTHVMNSTLTNAGGWKETEMVTYLNSDFYNKLPSDLQSVIIPTYPIVSGSGSGGVSDNITDTDTTKNMIYLLSGREVGFNLSYDNKRDITTDTRTLDYYAANNKYNARIKKNLSGSAQYWWLRSAYSGGTYFFYGVYTEGYYGNYTAYTSFGVAPVFRIGTMPSFTVSFDTDDGSSIDSQTITYGEKATRPTTDPTKSGYTFDDWYADDTYTTIFDFDNTLITSNTTIYAHFEELKVCEDNENITTLSENTCSNNENITVGDGIVCRRAIKLHEETCLQTDGTYYCSGAGYTESGSKGTSTITYGNCGTSGTLTSGDAFTCDVNNDGEFDELTERFYYVSDYYDTSAKEFDDSTAVLIYYNNVTSGVSCNKNIYAYDSSFENWHGPITLVSQLPSTSQWSNVSLKNTTRQILAETGATSTSGGALPEFDYTGYAARLLTYQEMQSACGSSGMHTQGYFDSCNYIMENTKYAKSSIGNYGHWLESPYSSTSNAIYSAYGRDRYVAGWFTNTSNRVGARPAIEVLKSKISY